MGRRRRGDLSGNDSGDQLTCLYRQIDEYRIESLQRDLMSGSRAEPAALTLWPCSATRPSARSAFKSLIARSTLGLIGGRTVRLRRNREDTDQVDGRVFSARCP
jgi:hypothetical protein